MKLALPSAAQWRDCNTTWEESDFTWQEHSESDLFLSLKEIVEYDSKKSPEALRRDVLHLDSAYKTGCSVFITSDTDISSKSEKIESLCGMKIFRSSIQSKELVEYIKMKIKEPVRSIIKEWQ